jgi:ATP-dependent Lon protease
MAFHLLDTESFFEEEFPTIDDNEHQEMSEEDIPEQLGILPLKNTVLFPGVVIPITVGRDKSINLVKDAYNTEHRRIGVVTQRNVEIEDPTVDDLYKIGTVARILKMIRMPDGMITIVIQGRAKFEVKAFTASEPYFKARVGRLKESSPTLDKAKALMFHLKEQAYDIIDLSPNLPSEAKVALDNITNLSFLINFIASNLNLEVADKQEVLEIHALEEKAESVLKHLNNELQVLELSEEIQTKVKQDLDDQQREYILRQQIKAIQDELGENGYESEIEEFRAKAEEKTWPEEVQEVFTKELSRLSRLNPAMPEYAIVTSYLERLLELPWQKYAEENFDFQHVQEVLDADHYGLEKVKDRILESLAVLKLKADRKAPILCFYGPPGVGKTSLGKSIARALDKDFVRVSLGGVHDEAEIRGHRRTYIGAMPGRIIQGLKRCETSNPVFMLDEIDKVGNDHRGDPASALLEVLDPEQNNTFRDNFLEVEYDLSRIMFIATANNLGTIHPALRDRMEIIELNSYSLEEKQEIAKRHLIPTAKKEHGLENKNLNISKAALRKIIENYTREAGVRQLNQKIAATCRVAAKEIVLNNKKAIRVNTQNLKKFLGVEQFENERYNKIEVPGVAVGLAWTPVGGDILFIEATLTRGRGRLNLTGRLGDVMKESATLAYTYLRSHCESLGVSHEVFQNWDVHVHVPAGAIPKDGPSAGITMLSALASLFTQRLVAADLAMTGEITLRGKVLPVGGIKEKVLAAVRAGIKTIIMSSDNEKDVSEIKEEYLQGIQVRYVSRMEEVLKYALEPNPIPKPMGLEVGKKSKEEEEKVKKFA